jgi:hypothetical protein
MWWAICTNGADVEAFIENVGRNGGGILKLNGRNRGMVEEEGK